MERHSIIKSAAAAAVAAIASATSIVSGGVNVGVDIRVGVPLPPPPPAVVVEEHVSYDTYVVGFRRNLYDADWRLRTAQREEFLATQDLDAARRHEGEVAVALEEQEGVVAQWGQRVAESDAALAAARAAAGRAADEAAEARLRLGALEKRIATARADLDASRTLRDAGGVADAEKRIRDNEAAAGAADAGLRSAEGRLGALRAAEEAAAAVEANRGALAAARERIPGLRDALNGAHDAVFVAQDRLTACHERVCVALHDRDESLWLIYRDDITFGRIEPAAVGFSIDLNAFGGRMPRDPEVLHAYFVHDVGFWRERPVEIETRIVAVDHVTEITRIREVQRVREPEFAVVASFETNVTIEDRRHFAERVVVERDRYKTEVVERKAAAAEHRALRVNEIERAEAKAIVMKAHAEAKATEMTAHANAKATEMQAHADAKATEMTAHGNAKATEMTAHADAKATEMTAHGNAKATEMTAHADAKSTEMAAKADSKATVMKAHADAKSTEMTSHADAKATETRPAPMPSQPT